MMTWIFIAITLSAAVLATFVQHMKRAILALWVVGLGVGAIYLIIGAEFLAIVQWLISSLTAISCIFFSVMFGEYSEVPQPIKRKDFLRFFTSILLGISFTAIIGLGVHRLPDGSIPPRPQDTDLAILGQVLTEQHLLALEVLSLTLFLVLVGGGVVARSEGSDS